VSSPIHDDAKAGRSEPRMTEIVEGAVSPADRVYAFDRIRSICREAPRPVRRVRARLSAEPHSTDASAAADCSLLVDGALIICAGVAATSMREAIEGLIARLSLRVRALDRKRDGR
jgi:ribosome-associated translation inhibitor RaiA